MFASLRMDPLPFDQIIRLCESAFEIRYVFAYNEVVSKRMCLVLVPHPHGGNHDYHLEAESSMDAVRKALEAHGRHVPDDVVLTVIIDGRGPMYAGSTEHNAHQPAFRHLAGSVRDSSKIPRDCVPPNRSAPPCLDALTAEVTSVLVRKTIEEPPEMTGVPVMPHSPARVSYALVASGGLKRSPRNQALRVEVTYASGPPLRLHERFDTPIEAERFIARFYPDLVGKCTAIDVLIP